MSPSHSYVAGVTKPETGVTTMFPMQILPLNRLRFSTGALLVFVAVAALTLGITFAHVRSTVSRETNAVMLIRDRGGHCVTEQALPKFKWIAKLLGEELLHICS